MKIIRKAQSENRKKGKGVYYELHHILPKSLYPLWVKEKRNLVFLTAREHFICHLMADKVWPNKNMFFALWRLLNDGQNNYVIKGSKEYEQLKIIHSKVCSERSKKLWQNSDYRKKFTWFGKNLKGTKLSETRKKEISESLKGNSNHTGHHFTQEQKENISKKTKEAMAKLSDEKRQRMSEGGKKAGLANKGRVLKSNQRNNNLI
jgi:hypothetical protein